MASCPSSLAFKEKAAYLALAVVSPLMPAFRFSMVLTGLASLQLVNAKMATTANKKIVLIVTFFSGEIFKIKVASCNCTQAYHQEIRLLRQQLSQPNIGLT